MKREDVKRDKCYAFAVFVTFHVFTFHAPRPSITQIGIGRSAMTVSRRRVPDAECRVRLPG
ncbi:MAG TPA: hypothetical protein VG269_12525 [Tepidisphaeraceae bacterium]|jgi:hypothetical protein|nr:hypothetical protein [Tepidisphaeraceae bacterium]